jgi:hypothetical protein
MLTRGSTAEYICISVSNYSTSDWLGNIPLRRRNVSEKGCELKLGILQQDLGRAVGQSANMPAIATRSLVS